MEKINDTGTIEVKNEKSLTDFAYLKQLSKGDDSFVKEMLTIFLAENPHETESLKDTIENGDFSSVYAAAHKLKSSTPFVGIFDHIKSHVLRIEDLAKKGEGREEMKDHFQQIDEVCSRARNEIREKMDESRI